MQKIIFKKTYTKGEKNNMQRRSKIVDFNNLLARQEYLVVQSNDPS